MDGWMDEWMNGWMDGCATYQFVWEHAYSCHIAGESGLKKSRCVHCQAVNQGVKQEVSEFFGIIISTSNTII
jgi:hypothetical protein